jgi:hypothetical protein
MALEEKITQKKPYEKPVATKLTREQAKLRLLGLATAGNDAAKELLDMIFRRENERSDKLPYEAPKLSRITREQAKLKLMGQVMMGDEGAMELLDILMKEEEHINMNQQDEKSA